MHPEDLNIGNKPGGAGFAWLHWRGGQPLHYGKSGIITARQKAIYQEDAEKPIRKSHENPSIIKLCDKFLGQPMSERSHHLLHTHYFDRSKVKVVIPKLHVAKAKQVLNI